MIEIKKPPDDFFKCVKVPIKHVLKHFNINSPKITNTVVKCNKIVIHCLQFMKLYLLDYYEKNSKLPIIDKTFINSCMKILCNKNGNGRPPKQETKKIKDTLITFYDKHYKELMQPEELDYTHSNTILDYLTIDIITMYENNIKQHYIEYIERYVNVIWNKKMMIEKIRKIKKTKKERDSTISQLCTELRKIKNDILNVENSTFKSKSFYHEWIAEQKKFIIPVKDKFNKNNLYYDLQCSPQDYFQCMIYMMTRIESDNYPINNVFPMRTEIIPKHIRLDTTTLIHLLITKKQGNKTDYLFKGNLKRNEDKIWSFFFRTELQCFKKKFYTFHHMVETDGISCSILLLRNDKIGKKVRVNKIPNKEKYIDELEDYSSLQNKTIVAIDPGKSDILYCVNGDTNEATKFRYSQDSKRKETKSKKYSKIILELKKEQINNKTIIEYETELSKFNHKTLQINEFKQYIQKKNEINSRLFEFYEKYLFRKLKLNGYINRHKNEQKMINKFTEIFGDNKQTIVCFGDFEQKKHMKFKEPIKGKEMRTLFRRNGYQTYLVDEFRTSCKCSKCEGGNCENFMVRENPKPFKNDLKLVWGLLKCKTCGCVWNRDCNGATNIYKISHNIINGKERPSYLCRNNLSVVLDDTTKPKFT